MNDDFKEAEGYMTNIDTIQGWISDKQEEISSLSKQGKSTKEAQGQLATLYESEKWNEEQLEAIYGKAETLFLSDEEKRKEYTEKRQQYSEDAAKAERNRIQAEVDAIEASTTDRDKRLQQYQDYYDFVSGSMEGRKATHEDYQMLKAAQQKVWKENAEQLIEATQGIFSSDDGAMR